MTIHLFNPENDLALANFSTNFTPPASALLMKRDLSLLPLWYANKNDIIAVADSLDSLFLERLKDIFNIKNTIIHYSEINSQVDVNIKPWGWSPLLKQQLSLLGVDNDLLPKESQLNKIRDYSNRYNAVEILAELKNKNSNFLGSSFYFSTIESLLQYISTVNVDQVLKMPLSGSGKGLIWTRECILTDKQIYWCKRVIKTQGGIVIEPVLNKVQDFAMEFEMKPNEIKFIGYSLFNSAPSGAYKNNILLPDSYIEQELSKFLSSSILEETRLLLMEKLSTRFSDYQGYIGVDMMICKSDNTHKIHPCIEINMRMNMGIIANRLYKRFIDSNSTGTYSIKYFRTNLELRIFTSNMQKDYPLKVRQGEILNGFVALIPVTTETKYLAYILVE